LGIHNANWNTCKPALIMIAPFVVHLSHWRLLQL
jgi:hypothetical protein